uniref:Transmembrane protein 51b n=1 Tax=Xiphophorus couchianus TaxID=32473 RepID=A0A3B5M1D0_9TELE
LLYSDPVPNTRSESRGSGAHYALCALGVGLVALGVVMIVWTMIPEDKSPTGNSTVGPTQHGLQNISPIALVLVGVGVVMLLLSVCLGLRSKRRGQSQNMQRGVAVDSLLSSYNVPSYDEVIGSGNYPVRQSNLRQSTSQLPSYEDILAAVENEDSQPANNSSENSPLNDQTPAAAEPSGIAAQPSLPTRSASRASRLLKPLRVRRIKSDKLHLKDFRLQIRTPTQNPVTIEPITPPPQYDNKMPELQ